MAACIRDAAAMREQCDLCICPSVAAFGMSAFAEIDALVRAGVDAATQALDTWDVSCPP